MATPNVILRSAIYLTGQVLSTLLLGPVMVLLRPFRFETRYAAANVWVRFNLWVLGRVCGLTYNVEGIEHIPREQSGLIYCKHQSAFETLALQVIFPPVVFILKRELLRIPFWGWAMATLEPIAIDRQAKSQALKQILREGEDRIKAGRWVVLFPEGTRVAPGHKGNYGSSGGMLAHRAGCPVLPVAHNAGEYWAKNGFLKHPGVIRVLIGPALDGAQLSAAEINRQAEGWIEARMAEITGLGPNGMNSGT
ncbi:MAG: 1-acyl-sn-glycerol-3-phosphate acyltransferase [Methylococcaceae bacterium]|nr:1-acyl-sn-glycerol-3-phosphate acyltransferase [Methylococcaceae bacterium]